MEGRTGFDGGRKPLGFTLRELHNLTKMLLHKMRPPCRRPGTPLTQLQGGILGYLYHHDAAEPVYQKNIEEVFRISRATATNTLQVMEKNGLIVRKTQERDARLKRIFMTEEACREHMQMEKRMEELDAHMLAGMSEEETEQFLRMLDRVRDNLERMNRECGGHQSCGKRQGVTPDRMGEITQLRQMTEQGWQQDRRNVEESADKREAEKHVTNTGCTDQGI